MISQIASDKVRMKTSSQIHRQRVKYAKDITNITKKSPLPLNLRENKFVVNSIGKTTPHFDDRGMMTLVNSPPSPSDLSYLERIESKYNHLNTSATPRGHYANPT